MTEKISAGTIARTAVLLLALVNQSLSFAGLSILPIEDDMVNSLVATCFTVVTSLTAWWQNNSFSKDAIEADTELKAKKQAKKRP